jgi:FkbM family methyltransferase
MPSLVQRLWGASPAALAAAARRRLRGLREREEWRTVQAGPATGAQLLLPVPLPSWAEEMLNGTFDAFMYETIRRHRSLKDAVCWDIGAHIGYHALAFASQGAQVTAFEPTRANHARLQQHLERNTALAPRIELVPAAVADRDGEMTLVESGDMKGQSTGSHLANATPPLKEAAYAGFESHTVRAVTIDTLILQQERRPPDIIKLDVEGAEHLVAQGGRVTLGRHKPLLLIEVHHICVMLPLALLLAEMGYRLEIVDAEHAEPSRCFICAR